jgi:hypothetical protein
MLPCGVSRSCVPSGRLYWLKVAEKSPVPSELFSEFSSWMKKAKLVQIFLLSVILL